MTYKYIHPHCVQAEIQLPKELLSIIINEMQNTIAELASHKIGQLEVPAALFRSPRALNKIHNSNRV